MFAAVMPILVLLAALAFAAGPFLSPFSGFDPALYPVPQVNPPAQPAGYAFSIWGIIYLWLIVHAGFGVWKRRDDLAWAATRAPMLISLGIGATWLFVAEVSPIWATVLIIAMAVTALMALFRTKPGPDRWLLALPIGLYAGWLTAASLVSLALLGAGYGIGPSEETWAWIAVTLALVLTAFLQRAHRVASFGLAVAWALIAVAVANWAERQVLAEFAGINAMIILTYLVSQQLPGQLIRTRRRRPKSAAKTR